MAQLNVKNKTRPRTHEGAVARKISTVDQLRRSVCACLLWEDQFYEDGVSIAERITDLVKILAKTNPTAVADIMVQARWNQKLRHVPLLLARELARHGALHAANLTGIIGRADEMGEFLALYWKDGKCPISKPVKRGLAAAFGKFDEYQFAKYNRGDIKPRDVLRLVHPKPDGDEQNELFRRIAKDELRTPQTWETKLSAGEDKKKTFTELIEENKLGGMALIRNLRNMEESGVEPHLIRRALDTMNPSRILPFRFITAAKMAPRYEPELENAMMKCLADQPKFAGETVLVVDNSWSMHGAKLSERSVVDRSDAACGLAVLLRELCHPCRVISFSDQVVEVAPRRGFALRDAIKTAMRPNGTMLGAACEQAASYKPDRIFAITDEQSQNRVGQPLSGLNYMVNVASYKNGVGYGNWTHIDGWSDSIVRFMREFETIRETPRA